jgi:hypothetical protein
MRTTLTIESDVAVRLERLQRQRGASLKELVNEALRRGLREMDTRPRPRRPFRTQPIEGTTCRLPNVDNVAEVLAYAEGEAFR